MAGVRRWALILAALAVLGGASLAQAFQPYRLGPNWVRWPGDSITFVVNTEGMPAGSDWAIQESMNTWSNAGANLTMVNQGASASHAYGEGDGQNLIDRGQLDSTNTIAETMWWYNPRTGQVLDSDIRLNERLPWASDGSANAYDVQNLVTHELGHTLVLGDLYSARDQDKTMYGYGEKGETKKRDLDADDIAGIKFLYP